MDEKELEKEEARWVAEHGQILRRGCPWADAAERLVFLLGRPAAEIAVLVSRQIDLYTHSPQEAAQEAHDRKLVELCTDQEDKTDELIRDLLLGSIAPTTELTPELAKARAEVSLSELEAFRTALMNVVWWWRDEVKKAAVAFWAGVIERNVHYVHYMYRDKISYRTAWEKIVPQKRYCDKAYVHRLRWVVWPSVVAPAAPAWADCLLQVFNWLVSLSMSDWEHKKQQVISAFPKAATGYPDVVRQLDITRDMIVDYTREALKAALMDRFPYSEYIG